tara:strand:- start:3517 stop:5958 length:2442 start_codon:yes stop_codon:yes gene_type:complete
MINIKNSLLIFFFSFSIFANQNVFEWESMTSLINPTSLTKDSNNNLIAATTGGLLILNESNLEILKNNLNNLDLSIVGIDKKGLIWLGGSYPNGSIQVLDEDYNLIYDSSYLEIESILDFYFSNTSVFVVYNNQNDIGVLEFNYLNDIPYYVDYYNNFPDQINSISDIDLFDNYIYLTTDQGIFRSNFIEDNLKLSASWVEPSYGIDDSNILFFHRNDIGVYLVTEQNLYFNEDNFSYSILEFSSNPFDIFSDDENTIFCNKSNCYEINNSVDLLYSIDNYDINNFYKDNDNLFFCIKNGGLMSIDLANTSNSSHFIPNTILQNKYDALTILKNGSIAAISETNGFIYDGEIFKYFIPSEYSDLFPIDLLSNYMNESQNIFTIIDYNRGDKMLWSIIENEFGNIMFNNSGIKPNSFDDSIGGIIEINPNNFNITLYDTSKTDYMEFIDYPIGVLDGLYGISNEETYDSYMVTNQINKDNQGNIWCITPYSEQYNHLASIQIYNNNQNWRHIFSNDNSSYYPTEVAFDKYNRAWMGFNYQDTWNNCCSTDFSKGGLKVFSYLNAIYGTSINDSSNVNWFTIDNPNILPNGENSSIWSLDIGQIDNEEVLWLLTPQGAQGYIINGLELLPIYPLVYYSNISFQKGDKIRLDSQNNAWITTRQNGVKIIQNNATLWPDGNGFLTSNSPLLSNTIYDIAFNNQDGQVYILTENGISILGVPFSDENEDLDELYISPQPFIIPNDEYIYIKKLISGSNVKILTINGYVVKEFNLNYNENIIKWDGRDELGNLLSSGIYYVTSYKSGNSISKKIAIIRN